MASEGLTYLIRRGGTFYFRRAVPASLMGRFGRAEIKVSLRTGDSGIARRRCRDLANRFENLVELTEAMPELKPQIIDRQGRSGLGLEAQQRAVAEFMAACGRAHRGRIRQA